MSWDIFGRDFLRKNKFLSFVVTCLTLQTLYTAVNNIIWTRKKNKRLEERRKLYGQENNDESEGGTSSDRQAKFNSMEVDGIFVNPFPEWRGVPLFSLILRRFFFFSSHGVPRESFDLDRKFPMVKPNLRLLFDAEDLSEKIDASGVPAGQSPMPWEKENVVLRKGVELIDECASLNIEQRVTFTWLGQSTCFIQFGGVNILTDPMFSERPIFLLGPKRLRETPCRLTDLKVDIVLVTHNHPDHLDSYSVGVLGNSVMWYVPLGLKKWFMNKGVFNVTELDWWEEINYVPNPSLKVIFTPSQHWSGRSLYDMDQSLWGSFVVSIEGGASIFHCGDTGYCQVFKEIGRRYGPFRLATIPIGSYQPHSLTQSIHVSPDEAITIHKDIHSQLSFGIHWGTFMVWDEHYLDPQQRITEIRRDHNFLTSRLGETRCMPLAFKVNSPSELGIEFPKNDAEASLSSSAILLSEVHSHSEMEEESGSEGYYTIS